MRLSRSHPRYASLRVRAHLADLTRAGLVAPEGLIAHGRGEAFDYLLGERTSPSARAAERRAADWLRSARRPVLSVNGNVAALAAAEVARLALACPGLSVEVNLFHRTPARARAVAAVLRAAGVRRVLGVRPTARIPGLPSDRARVDRRGIFAADLCLVPLEDGDRTGALRALGKKVVSIDLNPLSRTSQTADLPVVDELRRALARIADDLERAGCPERTGRFARFDRRKALADALGTIGRNLRRAAAPPRSAERRGRASPRPVRGTVGRSRRTP
ncbi:MAG TPA: phosphopantothenate/pantothenate synthetase [Thermoplasmata archaeon]|nr:phosphopantothenate/pantothenate synthetase [Thermoplasmata archaeon]